MSLFVVVPGYMSHTLMRGIIIITNTYYDDPVRSCIWKTTNKIFYLPGLDSKDQVHLQKKNYFNKRLSSTLKCRLDLNGNHDGLSDPFTKKQVCTRVYKIQVDNSLACENWKQIIPTQIFRLINMQINGWAETILREGEQSAWQELTGSGCYLITRLAVNYIAARFRHVHLPPCWPRLEGPCSRQVSRESHDCRWFLASRVNTVVSPYFKLSDRITISNTFLYWYLDLGTPYSCYIQWYTMRQGY